MIRIVADSAADFEPWELKEKNIDCVPLSVIFGDREYKENIDLTKEHFYELLRSEKEMPRTSQPSPQDYLDIIDEARENGDDVIIVTISSGLSGTYQSVVATKELACYDRCYVVDSLNGTGGERMIVEYAVRLRDEGVSAKEIVEKISALRSRVVLYTVMDTLEYLHRGGRISSTVYKIGSIAHIKPIMHVSKEGKAEIPAKTMGISKGIDFVVKHVEKDMPDEDFPFYVMFTEDRKNGEILRERLEKIGVSVPENRIIPVGAVIGTHIGPGACAVVYIGKE
ncbi:MAG: DegV family protein [Oscillospiraceae bacterium]|nr:DegV family protein [Oscillospiraceae bacterium]